MKAREEAATIIHNIILGGRSQPNKSITIKTHHSKVVGQEAALHLMEPGDWARAMSGRKTT